VSEGVDRRFPASVLSFRQCPAFFHMIRPKIPASRRESAKSAKGERRANGQVPMGMDQPRARIACADVEALAVPPFLSALDSRARAARQNAASHLFKPLARPCALLLVPWFGRANAKSARRLPARHGAGPSEQRKRSEREARAACVHFASSSSRA